jgi:AraC family transcriptional regulator of adaptative response/methylated-DNA-[protein]-cysteine methyltransferase
MNASATHPDPVAAALAAIDTAVDGGLAAPSINALARQVGTTPSALRVAVVSRVRITPKAYADARRAEQFRVALAAGSNVVDALFSAGYGSTSRVYERTGEILGMTPAAYRKGAPGETIRYALADSTLGRVIVGLTQSGVCFIAFDPTETSDLAHPASPDDALVGELARRFARAELVPADAADADLVESVVALVDDPAHPAGLPLDVRGTVFQQRVWSALTRIEPGATVTYGELARRIGAPSAVRAVAQACGANPLAVAVPCHRVIGADGELTGYRWGVARKRELLARERV